ncbi:MAG: glycoside hydrolase family 88 protein [Clostridia bacterium]|nr:glycoside hydrolase family 88 protein [Clostridia bacterium]
MKNIVDEGIRYPQKYSISPKITREYCERAIQFILNKIDQNLETFTYKFPAPASINNVYPAIDNTDWTSSFWTGMLWLAYEISGDDKYRKIAEIQLADYKKRIEVKICTDTHDLGFLYTLSCVAAYKLTGNEEARNTALKAADLLMTRYFEKAGIIQAWGDLNDPGNRGRMIIDCCMNLPLLYWATEMTGDGKYYNAAWNHVNQAAKYIVREDASSFHTYYMDVETGEPRFGKTAQGYSDNSCWTRGQAWGIYGLVLSYVYTGDWKLIELNKKITNYFLNRLPEDYICYWDLIFTEGNEERDSSGAAIAACGILEMAKHLPLTDPYREVYQNASLNIIQSLSENYTSASCPESNGLLLHAVYAKPDGKGIDECNIWGDYFYFEALVRLVKDWKLYW